MTKTTVTQETEATSSDVNRKNDQRRRKLKELKRQVKAADARILDAELKVAALKAGVVDLEVLRQIDLTGVGLNTDGTLRGVDALIDGLRKTRPQAFGQASTDTSTTATTTATTSTSTAAAAPKPGDPKKFSALKASEEDLAARFAELTARKG